MSFQGKTVLVTGGTSGIGRAAAERFASAGADVVISGRDQARGSEVVAAIESAGGKARFVATELTEAGSAQRLAAAAGAVDVLVNSAGIFPFGATHELPIDQVRATFEVNVLSTFALTAALVPGMVAKGSGAIVNVSSMVASYGLPGMSAYGASKAAVELLTKAWAAEYGPQGVRTNAVSPGPTRTLGTAPMGEGLDQLATTLPLGRPASAQEIANAIFFLASDEASYVNGAILAVDGGRSAV
jgi:NAD(P)-dependent dehydrogenase (short-subunit alcohol dehydrogenase family)